jgi:hypothetical protein
VVLSLWQGVARGKCRDVDFDFHPLEVDRMLRRAHQAWLASKLRRHVPGEEGDEHPLAMHRSVTGLPLFRHIGSLPEADPLRTPLRRWVYRLAEQRINQAALAALTLERQREHRHPDAPGRAPVSFAGMLTHALGDAPRREPWTRLLLEHAPPVSLRSVELWQRRGEIARRMGLSQPGEIEAPLPDAAALAAQLASTTRDRVKSFGLGSLAGFFERVIGADIAGDWPARLSTQRLFDYFRDGDLLRSIDLQAAPLPASLGASSFPRALGVLGAAWYEALAPDDQPFVIAHDPYGLGRHEAASLFSLLPLNARFARRHLDVSVSAVPDLQRRLAQIWLLDLAVSTFRVRLRPHALGSERAFREEFAELAHHDLGLPLSPPLAGAIFPLGIEDEQRFVGQLLAARRTAALIEAHDEDWFRNPRAIEQLRAEARLPPRASVEPEEVGQAIEHTRKWLERLLD